MSINSCDLKRNRLLGSVNPNPAFMTNTVHFFLAEELIDTGEKHLDEHEETETQFWDWNEVEKRLGDTDFHHGIILITAWFYKKHLESHKT